MNDVVVLLGRIGLSILFLVSGWGKLHDIAGTQQYMEAMGVAGALAPLVILAELGGGLAILTGTLTRLAAALLALFCLLTAFIFHADLGDQAQAIGFMKNLGLAGGFLLLTVQGAGAYSIDALWQKHRRS